MMDMEKLEKRKISHKEQLDDLIQFKENLIKKLEEVKNEIHTINGKFIECNELIEELSEEENGAIEE